MGGDPFPLVLLFFFLYAFLWVSGLQGATNHYVAPLFFFLLCYSGLYTFTLFPDLSFIICMFSQAVPCAIQSLPITILTYLPTSLCLSPAVCYINVPLRQWVLTFYNNKPHWFSFFFFFYVIPLLYVYLPNTFLESLEFFFFLLP